MAARAGVAGSSSCNNQGSALGWGGGGDPRPAAPWPAVKKQGRRVEAVTSDLDLGTPATAPILFAAWLGRIRWGIDPARPPPFPVLV
jgi:hypothetical protein